MFRNGEDDLYSITLWYTHFSSGFFFKYVNLTVYVWCEYIPIQFMYFKFITKKEMNFWIFCCCCERVAQSACTVLVKNVHNFFFCFCECVALILMGCCKAVFIAKIFLCSFVALVFNETTTTKKKVSFFSLYSEKPQLFAAMKYFRFVC